MHSSNDDLGHPGEPHDGGVPGGDAAMPPQPTGHTGKLSLSLQAVH